VSRGLSVRQGNIDEGLSDYPDASFDFVILSQTLPYVDDPKTVLCEMSRVGRQAIVSFPNLGHWRARLRLLLNGQLPESAFSPLSWHEAPRARPIAIAGFLSLCNEARITVATQIYLNGTGKLSAAKHQSLWATTGLFVLEGCGTRS
jgi:methionine biosynthesis protein MetW